VSADDAGTGPISAVQGTITTVHQYELPLPRAEVWRLISEVSQYRTWWPWLRSFEGGALASGEEWRCEVQPPVPYLVRFLVSIEHVEPAVLVRARVGGDVVGAATLTLSDTDTGCAATLDSSLAPGNRALRLVSRFAAPIARFGHDWVLDSGARQFIARAVEPLVGD
jgi:uncharacterized protein YndB with AHSA1/START domain